MPATRFVQYRSTLGQSFTDFASDVNTAVAALGAITVNDFDLMFLRHGVYQATLTYIAQGVVHGVAGAEAVDDPANPIGSVDDLNTFFAADTYRTAVKIRAISPQEARDVDIKKIMVLYAANNYESSHPWKQSLVIVRNTTGLAVAAGNTATMTIQHADGTSSDTITVRNRSQVSWAAAADGYAFYDDIAGEWYGYVTCCAVP